MSAALIADIETAWGGDATLSAVSGPWLGAAPDGTAYPYAVMKFVGDGNDEYYFDRTLIEEPHARFTIYHTTLATLTTYLRAMDNLLVQKELAGAGASTTDKFVRCTKVPGSRVIDALEQADLSGNTVYFATGLYAFKTQRTLP